MQVTNDELRIVRATDYLGMARRWWWLLLLLPLLASVAGYLLSLWSVPIYSASATLFVSQATSSSNDVTAARLITKTYGELITSREVLEGVIADLGLTRTVPELASQIHTNSLVDTQVIIVTTRDRDPHLAAAISNAIGKRFEAWVVSQQQTTLERNASDLQVSIDNAQSDIEKTTAELATIQKSAPLDADQQAAITVLQARLTQYQNTYGNLLSLQQDLKYRPQTRVFLSAAADPPVIPESPKPMRDAGLAFALGLGLAVAGVILIERVSDRIRTTEDISRTVNLPVLEIVPQSRQLKGLELISDPNSLLSESIRSLRTTLHFIANDHHIRTIAITSPHANDDKSIIAANLAVSIAQIGLRVVLIDGDLRQPRQHDIFRARNLYGLSTLLNQDKALAVIESVLVNGPVPRLRLLLAGIKPTHPSDLLIGGELGKIIAGLKSVADIIIIDAPPLLSASEAMFFTSVSDNSIIVADRDRTRLAELRSAFARIKQSGVSVLGVVLSGFVPVQYANDHRTYEMNRDSSAIQDHHSHEEQGRRKPFVQRDQKVN